MNTVTLLSKSCDVLLPLFNKFANLQEVTLSLHWDQSVELHTYVFLLKVLSFLNNFQLFLFLLNLIMQQNQPIKKTTINLPWVLLVPKAAILNQGWDKPCGLSNEVLKLQPINSFVRNLQQNWRKGQGFEKLWSHGLGFCFLLSLFFGHIVSPKKLLLINLKAEKICCNFSFKNLF